MARETSVLNGREVVVASCRGGLDRHGIIRSGFGRPYPFRVVSPDNGRLIRQFSAGEAKILRRDGCVGHIILAQ